jgi:hypothetical protein
MQRQQQMEDFRLKQQEQKLTMGEKVMDYLGRSVQGVRSQADLDALRTQLQQQGLTQYAAQLPPTYSPEAMQSIADRALSVKERIMLGQEDLKAQAAMLKAKREGISPGVTEYLGTLNKTWETATPQERQWAVQQVQQGKVDVSAAQGAQQAQTKTLTETMQRRLETFDKLGMAAQETHTVLNEAERLMGEGVYGNSLTDQATMAGYRRGLFQDDAKARRTARLQELGSQLVLAHGSLGSGVSAKDAEIYAKAAGNFQESKNVEEMKESIKSMRTILNTAIDRANTARERARTTWDLPAFERYEGPQAAPGGGQTSAGTLKPVREMSREELLAERDRLRKGAR